MTQQFRPFSANPSAKKLGSTCPIIIKHDFPNEDQNYLDEGLITLNSYKKRFRYDESYNKVNTPQRPMSALMTNTHPRSAKIRASSSKNWHPASKAEFLNSVMKSIKNREKNEIKPIRKLQTMYFHSILYKVKQQKEDLDERIRMMDNLKTDFKETDICILANTGAIDYILSLNAKANPMSCSNQLLKNEKKELQELKETRKILSQTHRPLSSHPIFFNPKKKNEKKPELLSSQNFYDENSDEFKILGNSSRLFSRPSSALTKNPSKNEISEKINGFINNCSRIKELYEADQQNQFPSDPELIEIPEVDDNYKSLIKESEFNSQYHSNKESIQQKSLINMRVKPQKLYKSSLTKQHESALSNSSMRVRAVEILNSTPHNVINPIHTIIKPKFFEEKPKIVDQMIKNHEFKELSVSGFSNKLIKVRNINEETEFEPLKTGFSPEKKIQRPMTGVQRPVYKENKGGLLKISPRNFIVDGNVFNMFSNVNIKKSINNRPQTAMANSRRNLANTLEMKE